MTKTLTKNSMTKAKAGMLAVQAASEQVQAEIMESEGFAKSLAIVMGLVSIEETMTDEVVAVLLKLQGNGLGFKSDKDSQGGYPAEVVKQAAIRAMMQGATLHGNEFNIISGQCYLTKEFYERKLREYPGLSDLVLDVHCPEDGTPKGKQMQLKVGGYGSCKINGKTVEVFARNTPKYGDQRFVVVAYDGDIDQAMGKAKKRLAQKLYERIAGVVITDEHPTAEAVDVEPVKPEAIVDSSLESRIATAVGAYDGCTSPEKIEAFDGKVAKLFSECDEDGKQRITDARNAAIERIEAAQ